MSKTILPIPLQITYQDFLNFKITRNTSTMLVSKFALKEDTSAVKFEKALEIAMFYHFLTPRDCNGLSKCSKKCRKMLFTNKDVIISLCVKKVFLDIIQLLNPEDRSDSIWFNTETISILTDKCFLHAI